MVANQIMVADIAARKDLDFVGLSQDVQAIKDMYPGFNEEYDSFFVKVEDGEYTEIYGMFGIVPWMYKSLYKLV